METATRQMERAFCDGEARHRRQVFVHRNSVSCKICRGMLCPNGEGRGYERVHLVDDTDA
jgi:hypothetical protein